MMSLSGIETVDLDRTVSVAFVGSSVALPDLFDGCVVFQLLLRIIGVMVMLLKTALASLPGDSFPDLPDSVDPSVLVL
jgi:hypothetical protein